MATVVLQTAGAAIGGAVAGPFGAIVGRAAGALAGNAIDQKLFAKDRVIDGPRLESARILSSTEGSPIPKAYGRNRLSGEIIWATRFEEVVQTEGGGGKGPPAPAPTTRTYSYFANFAVAICDGPISGIRRIWADAKELDLTKVEHRIYLGDETQQPDPLIEAKQGLSNAPAYRGTAYVVFETLPLEDYGNRIPQVSFEVVRAIGKLEKKIKAISVIPGATEYGYDPQFVSSGGQSEAFNALNRHTSIALSDWEASIDELQMVCPNLETVSLVVTWYGTDLRAEQCEVLPGVTHRFNAGWEVAGYLRHNAHLVSQVDGKSAFGGTPTDASLLRCIADLKSRGLKVVLYPFLMMDIPGDNTLNWIGGASGQPNYPWRGEISCFPPPGVAGTADKTATARTQLGAFSQKYTTMIEHYATLCSQAGGVNGFLIGSELRSLTRVRDQQGRFPFVETLQQLAISARSILGSQCRLTYGADWSEYFGYQPVDGSNDVIFNLDPLWSMPEIDAVGIDNYMPLSDWNANRDPSFPDVRTISDAQYLKSNIAAQEGYDWYYASDADRFSQVRTPITDGTGEPWVFRYKDLVSWWSNPHHNRLQGVRQSEPTEWTPQSKPFWLTELGCPAVDHGTNQPNVFFDEKSVQSALPWHSGGSRDDLIQRRYLEAHFEHWAEAENNPLSVSENFRMLGVSDMTPWAWDARPFPVFPLDLDTWSDGENWHLGHWLNGRLGGCPIEDLIVAVLSDYGYDNVVAECDGVIDGYTIPGSISAREALEPLLATFDIHSFEVEGKLVFKSLAYAEKTEIKQSQLVQENDEPATVSLRRPDTELPAEAVVHHLTVFSEYEDNATKSRRLEGESNRQITLQTSMVMPQSTALELAESRLRRDWGSRDQLALSLSTQDLAVSVGDIVQFDDENSASWLIDSLEVGTRQEMKLRRAPLFPAGTGGESQETNSIPRPQIFGPPEVIALDLPLLPNGDATEAVTHLAATADPWARNYVVYISPDSDGFQLRSTIQIEAIAGRLVSPLTKGVSGRWDNASEIYVEIANGSFQGRSRTLVLGGANLLALESDIGSFELVQFQDAELQPDGRWLISTLLRGQLGTEAEMNSGSSVGKRVVLMNNAVKAVELFPGERGLSLNWCVGPATETISSPSFVKFTHLNTGRNREMLSPVHVRRSKTSTGDFEYTWIRRGRINADNWDDTEIPLDAAAEAYQIQIIGPDENIKREFVSNSPLFAYPLNDRVADFGSALVGFRVHIAQLSETGTPGAEAVFIEPGS